jgi:hypothetical protein
VAACGSPDPSQLPGQEDDGTETPAPGKGTTKTAPPVTPGEAQPPGTPASPGNLPTNSAAGKAFYSANVHPILEAKCSGCHVDGGVGAPAYLVKGDPAKSYERLYAQAYVTATSRIVVKGVHSGGGAPELTQPDKTKWAEWIALEAKDGGQKTQTNVLEKFGTCFDKAKFDAIQFGQLRTIRRQQGNNPQNLTENANNCTGCDNAPCRTCHTADDVTGFIMAIGSNLFPPEYTFEQSKLLNPAFIRQYVSTSPTGEPQFNPALQAKSINTVEKAKAYEHPMYKLSPTMQAAIQAFVDDAVAKQKTGVCGK